MKCVRIWGGLSKPNLLPSPILLPFLLLLFRHTAILTVRLIAVVVATTVVVGGLVVTSLIILLLCKKEQLVCIAV